MAAAEARDRGAGRPAAAAAGRPAAGPEAGARLDAARERVARRQATLLAALVAGGPDPAGFDWGALNATRQALLGKRRSGVARRWPTLAAERGFADLFDIWAAARPPGGSFHDGLDFARAHPAILSTATRAELLYGRCAARRFAMILDGPGTGAEETLLALRAPGLGTLILRAPRRGRRRETPAAP